jgi:aromatic-L-amino-acid decarboxylase
MLNNKEFLKYARQLAEEISEYYAGDIKKYYVLPNVSPGDILSQLPKEVPEQSESFDDILNDFRQIIMPGITHWQHPRFFAYFPSNTSYESMLGEFLANALGVINFSWESSPAATELEQRVMQWLRKLINLPDCFTGVIHDTASTASLSAIMTAINKKTNGKWHEDGFDGKTYRLYCSAEAHSSIEKGAIMAGIGKRNVVKIKTDEKFALIPELLEGAINEDIEKGYVPFCVIGAIGTTGSLAVDPIPAIGDIAERYGMWFHIDAAFSGSSLVLEEYAHYLDGVEKADSFVFNPHKWLFTNFDCSAFFVKDTGSLLETFSISPEYLKTDNDDKVNNYKDWGIQLGRKFRALKLWFVLRSFGVEGIKSTLRKHIAMTKDLHTFLEQFENIEILAPVEAALICFRMVKPNLEDEEINELNYRLLKKLNKSGELYLTHTKLDGKFTLRLGIGKTYVEQEDIEITKKLLEKTFKEF